MDPGSPIIVELRTLLLENGELDEDFTTTYNDAVSLSLLDGRKVVYQNESEYTDRVVVIKEGVKLLDVRDNTFEGLRYSFGTEAELINIVATCKNLWKKKQLLPS